MNLGLFARAIVLRGGVVWLVARHYRLLPRRLPGPRFLARWATKMNAKHQGRKDGKLGLPTSAQMTPHEADYPAHLMYLKNRGDRYVRSVLAAMLKVGTRKHGRGAAIGHVRELINRMDDEREALDHAEKELAGQHELVERRQGEHEKAREDHVSTKEARRSADVWNRGLPRRWYAPLLVALTVAELPLLAVAFQSFFSAFLSVVVSLGVSIAIIFIAHVAGVTLTKRESMLRPADTVILWSILLGIISTIVALSFVRELYLQTNSDAGAANGSTWAVAVVFAIFNAMVFGAAVLVSKFRHSALAESVDDARQTLKQSKKQIRTARRRERRAHKRVSRVQDRIVFLDGVAASSAARVRTSVERARLAAATQKDFAEKCYALYARENARSQSTAAARKARLRPPIESGPLPTFNHFPEVTDPSEEFGPIEQELDRQLRPLEEYLWQIRSTTPALQARVEANGRNLEHAGKVIALDAH